MSNHQRIRAVVPGLVFRVLLLLMCATSGILSAAQWPHDAAPRAGDERITAVLAAIQQQHHIPAFGAAIVRSSGLVAVGVVGWRKLGDPTPVTVADQWHLGSNTKAMTAVLGARLVETGKLQWDSELKDIISTVPPAWAGVTLDQCFVHRAGAVANIPWQLQKNREMAVRTITMNPPLHQPGSEFLYSNAGYVLAGAMLEKVAARSWETLIREEVWQPLGIEHSGFGGMGTTGQVDQPWGHNADGTIAGNGPLADNAAVLGPGGTVHMPLADWALFIADQLKGARGQPALLQPHSYQHLHQPWPNDTYARGWIVVPRKWAQGNALTHSGSNTMHYAVVWMAPKIDFAVLICCNQGEAAQACDAIAGKLIQEFFK